MNHLLTRHLFRGFLSVVALGAAACGRDNDLVTVRAGNSPFTSIQEAERFESWVANQEGNALGFANVVAFKTIFDPVGSDANYAAAAFCGFPQPLILSVRDVSANTEQYHSIKLYINVSELPDASDGGSYNDEPEDGDQGGGADGDGKGGQGFVESLITVPQSLSLPKGREYEFEIKGAVRPFAVKSGATCAPISPRVVAPRFFRFIPKYFVDQARRNLRATDTYDLEYMKPRIGGEIPHFDSGGVTGGPTLNRNLVTSPVYTASGSITRILTNEQDLEIPVWVSNLPVRLGGDPYRYVKTYAFDELPFTMPTPFRDIPFTEQNASPGTVAAFTNTDQPWGNGPNGPTESSLYGVGEFSFFSARASGGVLSTAPTTCPGTTCSSFTFKQPALVIPFARIPAANFQGGSNEGRSKFISIFVTYKLSGASVNSPCVNTGCGHQNLRDFKDDPSSFLVDKTTPRTEFQPEFNLTLQGFAGGNTPAVPLEIQNSIRFASLRKTSPDFEDLSGYSSVKGRRYKISSVPYFRNYKISLSPDQFTLTKRKVPAASLTNVSFSVSDAAAATGQVCVVINWDLGTNTAAVVNGEGVACSGDPWTHTQ